MYKEVLLTNDDAFHPFQFPQIARSLAPYLKLDLMLHQRHALCWMTQMEELGGFGINSIIWEDFDGGKYYYSPALGQIRLNRPPKTVGGCVADEMGLGKVSRSKFLASGRPPCLAVFVPCCIVCFDTSTT